MRVKMLTSIAGGPGYAFGDLVELPDDVAIEWIRERMAEAVRDPAIDLATAKGKAAKGRSGRGRVETATADPAADRATETRDEP